MRKTIAWVITARWRRLAGEKGLVCLEPLFSYSVVTGRSFPPIFDWRSKMTMFLNNIMYPNLGRIVKIQVPAVPKNKQKFDAFIKFSQFSKTTVERALLPGFGPYTETA